ncbi:hypothetical protein N2152v2_005446 [Parachlorella kessleri]
MPSIPRSGLQGGAAALGRPGRRAAVSAAITHYSAFLTGLVGLLVGALLGLYGLSSRAGPALGSVGAGNRGHAGQDYLQGGTDGGGGVGRAGGPWRQLAPWQGSGDGMVLGGSGTLPWKSMPGPPADPSLRVNETVLWRYQPLLHPLGLARGLHSLGDPTRMRRMVARLLRGQPVTIVTLGTSVTAGAGSRMMPGVDTDWPPYPDQLQASWQQPATSAVVQAWLRAAFPASNATVLNNAQGGVSTIFYDACGASLLPEAVDLVVVEQVSRFSPDLASPWNTAYERLVRRLLQLPPRPAVVALQAYAYRRSNKEFQNNVENEANVYSAYYGLPILSMRSAVFPFILERREGYLADWGRKEALGDEGDRDDPTDVLYWDDIHPYGPTGHRYLAELLIGLVQHTAAVLVAEAGAAQAQHPGGPAGGGTFSEAEPLPLPPPMIQGNFERVTPSCLMDDALEAATSDNGGFQWVNERPNATTRGQQKWGWVSDRPGSWVTFSLDTRTSDGGPAGAGSGAAGVGEGGGDLEGPRPPINFTALQNRPIAAVKAGLNKLLVAYLASYAGMGRAALECVGGCQCARTVLDGHWTVERASISLMHEFFVTQHPQCHLRVTVLPSTSSRSKGRGHKVKILTLVVVSPVAFDFQRQPGARLAAKDRGGAAGAGAAAGVGTAGAGGAAAGAGGGEGVSAEKAGHHRRRTPAAGGEAGPGGSDSGGSGG